MAIFVTYRFLFTALATASSILLFALPANADESANSDITALIHKAISARDCASRSIPRARGLWSYKWTVLDKMLNVVRKERATFQMARNNGLEFIQFRYEKGAGYEVPDVYARVVLSDGNAIYESKFCQRILPHGVEGAKTKQFEKGSLQPVVWVSGNLAGYYGFIDRLLGNEELKLAVRDEADLTVVAGTYKDGDATEEFWIDPKKDWHIVRYRLLHYAEGQPFAVIDVRRQWNRAGELWHVEHCVYEAKMFKDGGVYQTERTEVAFDNFEPNVDVPRQLFSVHALGLPDGARILPSDDSAGPVERYQHDPQFDGSQVERFVGKLPTILPPLLGKTKP